MKPVTPVMNWLRKRFPEVFGEPERIIIDTPWGPTSESARLQGALNMKFNPEVKKRVEQALMKQCNGDREAALAEAKRRYPEAYTD